MNKKHFFRRNMKFKNFTFFIIDANFLNKNRLLEIEKLQNICFSGIDQQEIEEDFYHKECAHALAYHEDQLIAWAGIHQEHTVFKNKKIHLGGFGICVHPKWQKLGVASELSQRAMEYLKKQNCDLAFLSIDTSNEASRKLHKKTGFIKLSRDFSWINKSGQLKESDGGMIAPLKSIKLYQFVLDEKEIFHVGNGYW